MQVAYKSTLLTWVDAALAADAESRTDNKMDGVFFIPECILYVELVENPHSNRASDQSDRLGTRRFSYVTAGNPWFFLQGFVKIVNHNLNSYNRSQYEKGAVKNTTP